jgi:hypothetical protein
MGFGENVSEVKFQCTNFNTLQTLNIELNHFSGLYFNNILNNLLNLEYLNILSHHFRSEKLQLNQLLNLKYLSILNFNRYHFPLTIKNLKNLELIWIYGCNLDDDCFDGLSNLEYLFLHHVNKLPFHNFNCLQKLTHLQITDCDLPELELCIKDLFLPNLQHLSLINNKIEILKEGTFSGLKSLKVLDLSWNKLTKLDKNVFDGFDSLKQLDLSGNQLDDVEATLTDLKQINDSINGRFY